MIQKLGLSRLALPLALVVGLATPAAALGDSVATEQQQGAQVLTQVQHGKLNAKQLTNAQYQNLGEYLMGQALGSTQLHQRMNTLMDRMMGGRTADQMHIYLGKRYLGVSATPGSRYGPLYGLMGAMMSGYGGSPMGAMMGAYLNGRGTAGYTMGPGMMGSGMMGGGYGYTPTTGSGGGWPTGAVIAVVILGAVLLAAALAFAAPRLRRHGHTPPPTPS